MRPGHAVGRRSLDSEALCRPPSEVNAGAQNDEGSAVRHLRSENGQSLIESALVMTLLLLLVLGVINFALIFYVHVGVVNAASVAATYAATSPTTANDLSGITAAALGETTRWRCRDGRPIVTRALDTDPAGGLMVSVVVRCEVVNLIALPAGFDRVTVTGTAVRRVRPFSP